MATKTIEKKANHFLADKYRKSQADYRAEKAAHNETNKQLINASELNGVLTNENAELNKIYQDMLKRYEKECYNATVLNGGVINLVKLDAYREYIHMQEIDPRVKYINTALYQNNEGLQFVGISNGIITIDEKKYNKFLGGIL